MSTDDDTRDDVSARAGAGTEPSEASLLEELGVDADTLAAYPAHEPPAGFADRVLAAASDEPAQTDPAPRRRAWTHVVTAVAAAAVAFVLAPRIAQTDSDAPMAGAGALDEVPIRTEVPLGSRGVAVLEPGASLGWRVDESGVAELTQGAGDVFYRVEPGPAFTVHAPEGDIRVRGTCFSVALGERGSANTTTSGENDMQTANKDTHAARAKRPGSSSLKKNVLSGAVGAALAAGTLVTVYEGRVALANDQGSLEVAAGEVARMQAEQRPVAADAAAVAVADRAPSDHVRTRARIAALEDALAKARAGYTPKLVELERENARLVADLEQTEADLTGERLFRESVEGTPMDAPPDLPPAFQKEGLQDAFEAAYTQTGTPGAVKGIDCSEFPCIVLGEIGIEGPEDDGDKGDKALQKFLRDRYGEEGINVQNFSSTTKEDGKPKRTYGVSIYPDGDLTKEQQMNLHKRLRTRNMDHFDAEQAAKQ